MDTNDMESTTIKFLPPYDDKIVIPEVIALRSIAPNDIDALLSRDLNQLSIKDRDQVTQEIHGVSDVIDETSDPKMVPNALMQLERELLLLSDDDLGAYRLAHSLNPTYTTDPTFRIQFLRAERFRVSTAAQRLARYFREKLMLFGPEKVGKARITLEDLSEDDNQSLSSGYMQWLPERDRTGRAIYLAVPPLHYCRERSNDLRALWYFLSSALEDEETQKRGIVVIHFLMKQYDRGAIFETDIIDRRTVYHVGVLIATIPVRVEGMHVCCTQLHTVLATKILLYTTGEALRVRTRWHLGSFLEVMYDIASFGIPWDTFPIQDDGEFDMEPHHYWMERRRQLDQQYVYEQQTRRIGEGKGGISPDTTRTTNGDRDTTTYSVALPFPEQQQDCSPAPTPSPPAPATAADIGEPVIPRPQDVLLGGLKVTQTQIGNALFRKLVEEYRDEYERCATKLQKMIITKKIVAEIKSSGGARFLKQTNFKYGKDGRVIKKSDTGGGDFGVTIPRTTRTKIEWVEIPDHVARERISHAFRNLRARTSASLKRNNTAAAAAAATLAATAPAGPIAMSMNATNVSYTAMNFYGGGRGGDGACWNSSSGSHESDTFGCFGGGTKH